jgi:hypothetical protein
MIPPKQPLELFVGSELLSMEHQLKLNEWCKTPNQQWTLLYKASRDGFEASKFHDKCNNKGTTVSIIRSTGGYIFGGYTSISWTSTNSYVQDANSFVFTLINPHGIPPTMYSNNGPESNNNSYSIYDYSNYGPTFGGGFDLHVSDCSNTNLSSYTNFPYSYEDTTGYGNKTFTRSYFFQTNEIEVFGLAYSQQ